MASDSEVSFCLEAKASLEKEGTGVRVVSVPSWELFEQQSEAYRAQVLPSHIKARVSVEQASTFGWERYVRNEGCCIGINTFGASAPLSELQKKLGFTAEHIANTAKEQIEKHGVGA